MLRPIHVLRIPRGRLARIACQASLAVLLLGYTVSSAIAQRPAPADADLNGMEVLARGPVHEAFAATVSFDPQPGIVVPKAPPQPVEELPPDQQPEGEDVAWIPGYWGWDEERNDFLWISGVWRAMPPGRQWISGYWRQADGGYQWVSGYWGDAGVDTVQYLPSPPATLEAGPNVAAPASDYLWIPGNWVWRQSRYAWQPGYWIAPQPNWVWVPSYYVWTPGGYVFVNGYWDQAVARRGVLFAPVYFTAGIYSRPGFFYSPSTVISLSVFSNHLFCRPQYGHYYFGDYYAANYVGLGIYPWFSLTSYRGYDPIWAHQRWDHRHDRNWARQVAADYNHRRDHKDARPPHTWGEAKTRQGDRTGDRGKAPTFIMPIDDVARSNDSPWKFHSLDKQGRERLAANEKQVQQFRQHRQELEAKTKVAGREPAKVKLPKTPLASAPAKRPGQDEGRARPTFVQPDNLADRKPRGDRAPNDPRDKGQSSTRRPPQGRTSDRTDRPDRAERPERPDRANVPAHFESKINEPRSQSTARPTNRPPAQPRPTFHAPKQPGAGSTPKQPSAESGPKGASTEVRRQQAPPSARQFNASQAPRAAKPNAPSQKSERAGGSERSRSKGDNAAPSGRSRDKDRGGDKDRDD